MPLTFTTAPSMLWTASAALGRRLLRRRRRLPHSFVPPHAPPSLFSAAAAPSSSSSSGRRATKGSWSDRVSSADEPSRSPTPTPTRTEPADWREWFRSSDYDDPWSAYRPFDEDESSPSSSVDVGVDAKGDGRHKGAAAASSILDGTWERRRHGMNLEPLRMIRTRDGSVVEDPAASTHGEEYASAAIARDDDQEWTGEEEEDDRRREVVGGWHHATREEDVPRGQRRMRWIDTQTRFLCRMLDDLYRTGIRRETDRPRTERCHRAIAKLLSMTPKNPPRIHEASRRPDVTFVGLAQRAGEILRRMEQCSPPSLSGGRSKPAASAPPRQNGADGISEGGPEDDAAATLDDAILSSAGLYSSYQGVYRGVPPPHLSFTKYALPAPTREIYNMVLVAYAKESGPSRVAEQAEDVAWSMASRAVQRMRLARPDEYDVGGDNAESPRDDAVVLLPTIENWNCVLDCWSRSVDPDRAYRAYSFLLAWTEWNERCLDDEELRERAVSRAIRPNLDSFRKILQCCSAAAEEFDRDADYRRAREMGSGVAARLWRERRAWREDDDDALDSETYREVLSALCQTSELPCESARRSRALRDLASVFAQCREDDMVTPEILELVRAATTEKQFERLTTRIMGDKRK